MDDFDLAGVQVFADDNRLEALASYTDHLEELVAVYADAAAGGGAALDHQPAPGHWSVAQVVHHLADAELVSSVWLRQLLVEDQPVWTGWDADAYAESLLYDVRPPEDALTLILALRHVNSRLLASLPPAAWNRTARGPGGQEIDLAEWVRMAVTHLHDKVLQGRRAVIGMI